MVIRNIKQTTQNQKITVSAEVQFNGKKPEILYFIVDKQYADFIFPDASPFFAAVLLPCMKRKEDITIEGTISEQLFKYTEQIMVLVTGWNIGLSPVGISAREIIKDSGKPKFVGTFFSAGVDSFYTYLKHTKGQDKITHFLLIHGFDIPLENRQFFNEVKTTVEAIAKEEGVAVISIETNTAEIIEKYLVWDFAHGGALAAAALLLRKKFRKVFIPGAVRQDEIFPYGTHPDLDKLWSTETLGFVHDGTEYNRLGKIEHGIARSPLALKYLRVCAQNVKGKYNCSKCYKCLMTMIQLICARGFDQAQTFDKPLDLDAVRNMYYDYKLKYNFQGEANLALLRRQNREPELQEAIAESLERSKHPKIQKKITQLIANLDQRYNDRRLYRWVFKMNNNQDRNILFKFLARKGFLK